MPTNPRLTRDEAARILKRRANGETMTGARISDERQRFTPEQMIAFRLGYEHGYRAGRARHRELTLETEVVNLRAKLHACKCHENPSS